MNKNQIPAGRAAQGTQVIQKPACRLCRGKGYIMHRGRKGMEKRSCPHCGGSKQEALRTK